jgi:5-deoxy-glucuronate isomerase
MGTGGAEFNNLLKDAVHETPSAIDFAAHAASMGATSVKVSSISELEEALAKRDDITGPYVIVIDTDPYPSTPHGGSWWEVGVPEVSVRSEVNDAWETYRQGKATQKTVYRSLSMSDLLKKPFGKRGKVHQITPESAGWRYVGFSLYHLKAGDRAAEVTGDREVILVLVEGKAAITGAGQDWGVLGERMNVFEKTPPHCLYLPNGTEWSADAETDCVLAVCSAPGMGGHQARRVGPDGITLTERGKGTNTRHINNIAMENEDYADSLLVTEVFTPAGHWSSFPSHRHDEDDYPRITYLEETYYHRLNPANGFGIQRVYTDDGQLDETMAVSDGDVVLVPRGHHPCGAPYGFEMYYLNVMAGPLRKWRFVPAPEVEWIMQRDAD